MAKVKVNHNGSCAGYSFQANKAFEVSDADVTELQKALGGDLTVEEAPKKEQAEAAKEAKPANDKMVKNDQKDQKEHKVVTK